MRPSGNLFKSYIKFYRNLRVVGISASVTLAAFMTLAAFPITLKGNVAEAMTGNPASTILTMTSASASANLDLVVRNTNGTFSTSPDLNSARFSITTDNYTGYKLLIAGTNDTRELVNSASGTALESITTAMDAGLFGGDTATSLNGKWGYKPSKLNSTTNTNFLPAPTTSNLDTLDITNSANSTANNYIIALGARADYSTVPGTYTNTFVLTAVANNIPYTINFNDNTEDSTVANLPATISGDTTSTSVALPTTIPTRTGYTFAGWCDTVTTINANGTTSCTNPDTGVDGTVYPASTTTTTSYLDFIDQTVSSNIANLYAMWTINTYSLTINFAGTGVSSVQVRSASGTGGTLIGTVSSSGDSVTNLVYGTNYYLYPTFLSNYEFSAWAKTSGQGSISSTNTSNPYYTIGDGNAIVVVTGKITKLYMQDLVASDCSTDQQKLVYDKRDDQTYYIKRLADGSCWMLNNLKIGKTTSSLTLNAANSDVQSSFTLNGKKSTPAFHATSGSYVDDHSNYYCSDTYGCYYNFYTATAGSGHGGMSSAPTNHSICPKGWTIPTTDEFTALSKAYGSSVTALLVNPTSATENINGAFSPGFVKNGYYTDDGVTRDDRYTMYWAARGGSDRGYTFAMYGSTVYEGSSFYTWQFHGIPMRCIHKGNLGMTMQEIGNLSSSEKTALLADMPTGVKYEATDSRDSQTYAIAKLVDGNLWMTKNLNLAGGTTLTSSTSNVTFNYTLPASSTDGFSDNSTAYVYNSGSTSCGNNSPCYSYYSYVAATAGTNPSSGDATSDICPKGWRLPTEAEFNTLKSSYSDGPALTGSPFLAVYGGRYYSSSFLDGGSNGRYWSSTAYDSSSAYYLFFNSSGAAVGSNYKRSGFSVRCVLDTTPTMQDFTASDAAAMATGETETLKDSRDGQKYTVAKLPDGKVWMTKNLDLAGGTTLTSANSNVTSNYTLPASSTSGFSDVNAYVYNSGSTSCGNNSPCYSYYSYVAATAGTNPSSGAATSDICPKGWRLPTQAEFNTLKSSYSTSAALTGSPFLAVYGGNYSNSSFNGGGSWGYYWSSTTSSSSNAYFLYFDSGGVFVSNYPRRNGYSVRCVKS